jgi:hypothetical protein
VPGFGVDVSAGQIGAIAVTAVAAATAAHGLISIARMSRNDGDTGGKPVKTGSGKES